jgi:hypothetical protein
VCRFYCCFKFQVGVKCTFAVRTSAMSDCCSNTAYQAATAYW